MPTTWKSIYKSNLHHHLQFLGWFWCPTNEYHNKDCSAVTGRYSRIQIKSYFDYFIVIIIIYCNWVFTWWQ
jgi:hypothetical protein